MGLFRSIIFKISILTGIILAFFILYIAVKENQRGRQIEGEIDTLRQEAEKMEENNYNLQEKISYFVTQEFQERAAKEKLNLQKPDEKVAVVKPSISREVIEKNSADGSEENIKEEISNYLKWYNQFFEY